MKKIKKGSLAAVLAIILAILTGGVPVFAGNGTSPSITITVNQDERYIEGSTFRLYKVADLNGGLNFSFTEKFKNCKVDLNVDQQARTTEDWMKLATDLVKTVREQGIKEDAEKEIRNREVTFEDLSLGLYLIQGDTTKSGGRTVTYQPVVTYIPQGSNYSVQAQVKTEYSEDNTPTGPAETETPTPTPTSKVTESPSPTDEITDKPNPTGTEKPNPTKKPEDTNTPNPTKTPGGKGNPTTTPKPTRPSATTTPAATPAPKKNTISRLLGVKTGDTSKVVIYVVVMAAAAAALAGTLAARKRHSK